ncbi:MAG: type II toxin-antitoxin system HicB family antitoxin [Gaiellaceae bacterium]
MANAFAAVLGEVSLEVAERCHAGSIDGVLNYPMHVELHVVFEPDEQGWVRATIEELPSVITCAPTLEEARELIRDALAEWLAALTSEERATAIGTDARRETMTLTVA